MGMNSVGLAEQSGSTESKRSHLQVVGYSRARVTLSGIPSPLVGKDGNDCITVICPIFSAGLCDKI